MKLLITKFLSLFFIFITLLFSSCSDNEAVDANTTQSLDAIENSTSSDPVTLGSYAPSYKEINTLNEAILAVEAINLDSKIRYGKSIADALKEDAITEISTSNTLLSYAHTPCDNGGDMVESTDTTSSNKSVDKRYDNCTLNGISKNGHINATWASSGPVNITLEYYSNNGVVVENTANILYTIFENENDFNLSITTGTIHTHQESDNIYYSDFEISYVDSALTLNGTLKRSDNSCLDGLYLVATVKPLNHYGYDDTQTEGALTINGILYEFNDDERVSVTINGKKETLDQDYFRASCPEEPSTRK